MGKNKLHQKSQQGLELLYESITELLKVNPNGLTNTEIAKELGLESDQNGKNKNYLSYSLLGNLMNKKIVEKFNRLNKPFYRIC
jgi:hypothetical protein